MLNPPHLLTPNERINYSNTQPYQPHNANHLNNQGLHPLGMNLDAPKPRRRKPRPPASISKLNRPLTRFFCNDCKKKFRSRILANRNNNAVQHYCSLYGKIITRKVESHSNKCKGDHGMGPCVVKRTDDDPDSDGEDETKAAYYADKGKAPRQRKRRCGAFTKDPINNNGIGMKRKRNEFDNNINCDMNGFNSYDLMQNNKRVRLENYPNNNNNNNDGTIPPFDYNDGHYYANVGYMTHDAMNGNNNENMPPPPPMINCFDNNNMNGDTTQSTSISPHSIPLPIASSDCADVPPPPALEPIELMENNQEIESGNNNEITIGDYGNGNVNNNNNNNLNNEIGIVPDMIEIGDGDIGEIEIETEKIEKCKNRAVVIGVNNNKAPILLSFTDMNNSRNNIGKNENDDINNNESDDECINDDLSDNEENNNQNNNDNQNQNDNLNENNNQNHEDEDDDDDDEDDVVLAIPE